MQQILLNGKIYLDENDQSRMNYIIQNTESFKQTSITDILDTIHNSKNAIKKLIRVVGKVYSNGNINNNDNNNQVIESFHCFEGLYIKEETKYVESYYVGNYPLEQKLYEWAENNANLEILIEDYTNSIGEFINNSGTTEDIYHDTARAM